MTGNATNISIRVDIDLKVQADALFTEFGVNLTMTFNISMHQSLREGGIPFEVRLERPNEEAVIAMLEAERIAKDPSVKSYNDLDELFANLKRWEKPNIPSSTRPVSKRVISGPLSVA